MNKDITATVEVQGSKENKIDIAGFEASREPYPATPVVEHRTKEELDSTNLAKARSAGLPVDSLDQLAEQYNIPCIRTVKNLWEILGYKECPRASSAKHSAPIFNQSHVSALAFTYPNIAKPGEVYQYKYFVRIRCASKIHRKDGERESNYVQPSKGLVESRSEPYFLIRKETWDKVYSTDDLILTEGELKAIALAMTGEAGVSFPGCWMWTAGDKADVRRLHRSLDPTGPWKRWAISILNRVIYLLPDSDYRIKDGVKLAFREFAKALFRAGAKSVRLINIPDAPYGKDWKGIDDYLLDICGGPGWGGRPDDVALAKAAIQELKDNAETLSPSIQYSARGITNTAERLKEKLCLHGYRTVAVVIPNCVDTKTHSLASFRGDRYVPDQLWPGAAGESGRMKVTCEKLINDIVSEREIGMLKDMTDGDIDEPEEIPANYIQTMTPELFRIMPRYELNSFTEPYQGVESSDTCVGIKGALINITKLFECGVSWEDRASWLLPPTDRWVSFTRLNVSLTNLHEKPICPLFMDTITHAFGGDQESINCLQLSMGKIVTSPMFVNLQKFLCIHGVAGSGKGTTIDLLTEMVGKSNIATLDEDSTSNFSTSELPGKTLIMFRDTEEHFSPKMGSLIKKITGEDTIRIERKHAHEQYHDIRAEIVTVGNTPPVIPMDAGALRRRAIFLKFINPLKEQNNIAKPRMIECELPGIFLWALEGAARLWGGEKLTTPSIALADLQDILEDFSPERQFINSELILKSDGVLSTAKLFEAYQSWLSERRKQVSKLSMRTLCRHVREHFKIDNVPARSEEDSEKYVRVFKGIGLRTKY